MPSTPIFRASSLFLMAATSFLLLFLGSVNELGAATPETWIIELAFAGTLFALAVSGVALWLKAREQSKELEASHEALKREVADRRRTEVELRASEVQLRTLVDHFPCGGVFLFDSELRFSVAGGQGLDYANHSRENLEGKTLKEALTPEKFTENEPIYRLALLEEPQAPVESRNGDRIYVNHPHAVRGRDGRIIAGMLISIDVTDMRHSEEERRRIAQKLTDAQRLESLGVLAGGIAHDFNNMLAAMLGHAEVLALDLPPRRASRESVEAVITVTKRASELVKHMLAYAGKGRVTLRPVSLNEVIDSLHEMLTTAVGKHARVVSALGASLPAVMADPAQLRQILLNLLTNASEAIPAEAGGTITLTTGLEVLDAAALERLAKGAALTPGTYVRLTIADTGSGMAPETAARLFEPFFTTKPTGRGLGLAAVQGLVRSHRGVMSVESALGEGSTFRVWLPACNEAPEPLEAPRSVVLPAPRGTVLVIDDEEVVRVTLQQSLKRLGYTVRLAEDGTEGIAAMRDGIPDLLLVMVDLTMPDVPGTAVVRTARTMRPDIPVILMSGYREEDVVEQYGELGQAGFLHKPFSLEELRAAMRDALLS
ncbi:hybrid sensor histidine kinase/response regulator [Chondromyces apiculatus]|uniref:histidine kinase n=1 Tax=Chondromyces apiculatus DSM 436 TaxID=1192034 RepID=A0A017SUZ1_9BACT|nr:ATP-binding protein [Chondromyces apiculatus]EYF00804.1 Hypothetical protein CAP_9023 [Chondromyces apiculatus DSM 436]